MTAFEFRGFSIRRITVADNQQIAKIIRTVMPEFGADKAGFAIHDAEVDAMAENYQLPQSDYLVVEKDGKIFGGAGYGPLKGGPETVCELRKMYFLPEIRGLGIGKIVAEWCLREAKFAGFQQCYLETLKHMHRARALYLKMGFREVDKPLGATGHFGCDCWYLRDLTISV